jgi:hypothetical protein
MYVEMHKYNKELEDGLHLRVSFPSTYLAVGVE